MGVWVRSQSSNWLVFASEFYIKTKDGKNGISDVLTTDNQPLAIYSSYKKSFKSYWYDTKFYQDKSK